MRKLNEWKDIDIKRLRSNLHFTIYSLFIAHLFWQKLWIFFCEQLVVGKMHQLPSENICSYKCARFTYLMYQMQNDLNSFEMNELSLEFTNKSFFLKIMQNEIIKLIYSIQKPWKMQIPFIIFGNNIARVSCVNEKCVLFK